MEPNKTIRWKTIWKKTRKSHIIAGDYCLSYIKNKITEAPKDTMGIFCFEKREYAEEWKNENSEITIIKVKTFGKGKSPQKIADTTCTKGLIMWYENTKKIKDTYIVPGTICYPAVMPLE